VLKLDGNPLVSISSLSDLPELEVLGLARCRLQALDRLPKVNTRKVQDLDLSYNALKTLPAVPETVKTLSAGFNKLSELGYLATAVGLEVDTI